MCRHQAVSNGSVRHGTAGQRACRSQRLAVAQFQRRHGGAGMRCEGDGGYWAGHQRQRGAQIAQLHRATDVNSTVYRTALSLHTIFTLYLHVALAGKQ